MISIPGISALCDFGSEWFPALMSNTSEHIRMGHPTHVLVLEALRSGVSDITKPLSSSDDLMPIGVYRIFSPPPLFISAFQTMGLLGL